jgi:hypothetical protein
MRTTISVLCLAMLSAACVSTDLPESSRDASDPRTETAPPQAGIGALAADFDPERVAPPAPAGADPHAGHGHGHGPEEKAPAQEAGTTYTCPHHPEVVSDKPGSCPKCGMDLEPKKPPKKDAPPGDKPAAPAPKVDHSGHGGH